MKLNNFVYDYCNHFKMTIKKPNNISYIYDKNNFFIGLFKDNEKYIYLNNQCYKKSDLAYCVLSDVEI